MMRADEPSFLTKILAAIAGIGVLILGFMFSLVILAVFVVAGFAAWAYIWWRTRDLRKAMRQRPAGGQVIDGEAVVVDESRNVRAVIEAERPPKPD